ncbi:hypothetical protein HXX76_014566 [Chlamydomonas incerta]|uniref:Uncharacterized protein n=1 Tax=Chlamydomonas incerta TaxID=51695 RepID=A0A835SBQ4_CHLIN|nr:hypothetical protein HXX76_014566 [Chlamydomonas incerta]|eukprot:KAG2424357.1 hypothetical protein HXX76_014566 [Chlamydomonas incerta]
MGRVGPTGQVVPRLLPLDVRREAERQCSVDTSNASSRSERQPRGSATSGNDGDDVTRPRPASLHSPSPPASISGVPHSRLGTSSSGSSSAANSAASSAASNSSGPSARPSDNAEATPFSTAAAPRAAQPTSNAPAGADTAPAPAAPPPMPIMTSRSLTGIELARIALSSCNIAEQQLTEISAASARSARGSAGYPGSPVWLPGIASGAGSGAGGLTSSMSARLAPLPSPLSPSPVAHLPASGSQGHARSVGGEVMSAPAAAGASWAAGPGAGAGAGVAAPGRQQQSLMQQLQQQARLREHHQQQQSQPQQQPQAQQAAQLASAPQASGSASPERRGGWAKLAGASRVPAGAGPRVGWGVVSGQHIATAADRPSHGGAGPAASTAASNMAMRMVQGLQERDEFSLVAAARQRQLRKPPAASRSMIFHAAAGAAAANAAAAAVVSAAASAVAAADEDAAAAAAAAAESEGGVEGVERAPAGNEGEPGCAPPSLAASRSLPALSDLCQRSNSCPALPAFRGIHLQASPGAAPPAAAPSPLGAAPRYGASSSSAAAADAAAGGDGDGPAGPPSGVAPAVYDECVSQVFAEGALSPPPAEAEAQAGWSGSSQSVPLPQIALTARPAGSAGAALASKMRRASAFVPESPRIGLLLGSSPSAAGGSEGGAHSLSSDGENLGLHSDANLLAAARRLGSELSARSFAANNPAAQAAAARSKAAADAVAAAADAAAALAAVRALESRYGSAVAPDHQLMALEQEAAFRDRSHRLHEALQAANPAAYSEEAAEAAEAAYRALAERAKLRLKGLLADPTTQSGPMRQLQNAVRELNSQRPFFMSPVLQRAKAERPFIENRQRVVKEVVWSVDESIFAQRKKENEARDLFDTEKVVKQQLSLDWQRIVSKSRFRRLVARGDAGVKNDGQSLDEELSEVREELERQSAFIRSAFNYYSMKDGALASSDVLQMGCNAWLNFCNDAGIVHPTQRGCTVQDLQTIFISVNFEEESDTTEADANDDDAMVRFEFMEGIVRAAFGKYIASKKCTDASDAVGMLLEEISSAPDFPPEAKVEANDFRRNRFYTRHVEEVLKEHYDLLLAMFKLYKARDRSRLFWPEHWAAFLDSNKLLGLATGVERREAKLIFGWSQALVTDELRRRQRAVSLTFWDFVEAVARLADLISAPDHEDIIAYFLSEGEEPPELERLVYEYYRHVGDAGTDRKRESAELVASPSRPLEVKLRLLMEYLVVSLREAWGGKDAKDVAAKVMKMATYLSGGIEMG